MDQNAQKSLANGSAVTKSPETKEIASLLDVLSMATVNLEDNVSELSLSLMSIKRNEPSKDPSMAERQASTDLGQFLAMVINRVERINNTVRNNRDELEL